MLLRLRPIHPALSMERNQLPRPASTSRRRQVKTILRTRKVPTSPQPMPLLLQPTHHILLLCKAKCPLVFKRHRTSSRQLNSSSSRSSSRRRLPSQPNTNRIVPPEMIHQPRRFLQSVIAARKQVHSIHSRINRLRYNPPWGPLLLQHSINPRRLLPYLKSRGFQIRFLLMRQGRQLLQI